MPEIAAAASQDADVENAVKSISSPLDLLGEEERAREVLLLSFTLNLEFWERYALSVARGLGARVTVVGDAAMVETAPGHVRYAGITYLDGRAMCRKGGAFHPKLLVIASEEYATVAIGSGNATLSGWHDNAELWTVLRGDTDGAPETFAPLAAWLRVLPSGVRFSARVEHALESVAELLEQLPATEPGPQLLTTFERPIIDQLPLATDAGELVVASPFYDRRGRALQELLERLEPRETRLFVQPRDVVADGGVLAKLLAERNGQAVTINAPRYFHGKLVEWSVGGRRFALTGSPNLSWPALGKTLADEQGNCELGLLSEIHETLAPPSGGRFEHEQLAAITLDARFETPPALILLGVLRAPDRVAVTLGRPLEEAGVLEHLVGADWELAAAVPAAVEEAEFAVVLDAGAAVRVRQGELISNVCFVADPSRFTRRRVEHLGRTHTDEEDVFRDPSIADAFAHDLAELRQFLVSAPTAGGGSRQGSDAGGSPVSFTSWEEYLDACEAHLGERLLAYGFALPVLGSGEGRREEGGFGTLDDDTADGALDGGDDPDTSAADEHGSARTPGATAEGPPTPQFVDLSEPQRRRYRRWCERLAELAPQLPYAGRLVALRLILDAVRGELFPRRDQWLPLVAAATGAVGAAGEAFEQERPRAASLAAVALAAMRGQLHRYGEWEELRFPYEDAVDAVRPLLPAADPDATERYAAPLESFFGPAVQPAAVEELVMSLLEPDPIAEAVRLAKEELGLPSERQGNVIELSDPIHGDPRRTLLAVISLCEETDVTVKTPDWDCNHHAVAVWRNPELVLEIRNQAGVRGALYELRGFGPGTYKDDVQGLPRPIAQWTRDEDRPERLTPLLER